MDRDLHIHSSLIEISNGFEGVLLDAYGVFWGGNQFGVLPGCEEIMRTLVEQGKIVGILSNSSQLAAKEREKVKAHGLIQGIHYHFFLTSGECARQLFLENRLPFPTPKNRYWTFGGDHPRFSSHQYLFEGSVLQETEHLEEADFIYVSIPHLNGEDQLDPELFREKLQVLKPLLLPMVCVNPDRFAHEGNPPRPVVRQGSIAAMYEEMGGFVLYLGKPSSIVYQESMKQFQEEGISNLSKIVMVGDTPETDIRGARNFGMKTALITQTGIMGERVARQGREKAFELLPESDIPDYYIERLAKAP